MIQSESWDFGSSTEIYCQYEKDQEELFIQNTDIPGIH